MEFDDLDLRDDLDMDNQDENLEETNIGNSFERINKSVVQLTKALSFEVPQVKNSFAQSKNQRSIAKPSTSILPYAKEEEKIDL